MYIVSHDSTNTYLLGFRSIDPAFFISYFSSNISSTFPVGGGGGGAGGIPTVPVVSLYISSSILSSSATPSFSGDDVGGYVDGDRVGLQVSSKLSSTV